MRDYNELKDNKTKYNDVNNNNINNSDVKNNGYFRYGINGLMVVIGGIFFYYILFHSEKLGTLISSFTTIMTPIIAGFAIAYILNPIMVFIEDRILYNLFCKKNGKLIPKDRINDKQKKIFRFSSVLITLIIFLAMLYGLIMMIVPQIVINVESIIDRVPSLIINISSKYNDLLLKYPTVDYYLQEYLGDIYTWFSTQVIPVLQAWVANVSTSILGSVITIFKSVLNFLIGIIISIYLLTSKEKFLAQGKKVLYALKDEHKANNIINNLRYADKIFGGFITGKVVDSIIIGILCYIGMLIANLPYAALISVLVGVTNVIPYFGPFIGAIPSAFIILLIDPKKCLIFVIFVLILQQFDGNILGPKILGGSTGLSSFWVIFAITVFSGLFGILGMFLGVPLFALIYAAFRTFINERLLKKNMPVNTDYYVKSDFKINEDEPDNSGETFRFAKETFDGITKVISDEEKTRRNSKKH